MQEKNQNPSGEIKPDTHPKCPPDKTEERVSLSDLMIMQDTLIGSLGIDDSGRTFKYKKKVREDLINKIYRIFDDYELDVI